LAQGIALLICARRRRSPPPWQAWPRLCSCPRLSFFAGITTIFGFFDVLVNKRLDRLFWRRFRIRVS